MASGCYMWTKTGLVSTTPTSSILQNPQVQMATRSTCKDGSIYRTPQTSCLVIRCSTLAGVIEPTHQQWPVPPPCPPTASVDDTKAGVKGLVDAGVTEVPYIFHHPPEGPVSRGSSSSFTIPVIDLAALPVPARRADLVAEVKAAAETVGFFQVVNHGVPGDAMSGLLAAVRRFNEEPAEAKRAYYSREPGRRVKYQSNFDLFQSPAASWRDTLFMEMGPEAPAPEVIPPACRDAVLEYDKLVRKLGGTLLGLLSEALGLRPDYLERDAMCLEGLSIAAHYYPACPEPHLTMGTTRHSDPSFLTVLLQDAVGGLQVFVDGVWVDVPAVGGALVVNIGDYLQLVSNDRLKSVEHRVVTKSVGPRVSVACFFRANGAAAASTMVEPIVVPDGCGGVTTPRYRSTTVEELVRHYRGRGLDGSSTLEHFRL